MLIFSDIKLMYFMHRDKLKIQISVRNSLIICNRGDEMQRP